MIITLQDIFDIIDWFSAADVVEVVRRKDCYYQTHEGDGKPYCLALEMYLDKELDFFCSYGERRADNDS